MSGRYQAGDEPIPELRLVKFLGQGGIGEVWKATAPGGIEVAIKFINLGGVRGIKEFAALKLMRRLRHPNLVPLIACWLKDSHGALIPEEQTDVDRLKRMVTPISPLQATIEIEADSPPRPVELIVAMGLGDYDLGGRLLECQKQGHPGIPPAELIDYMEESAKAIDYLNAPRHDLGNGPVGIQHCDIKPFNIMVVGGAVQVCDFGLARIVGDVRSTSSSSGTIAYVAPECLTTNEPSSATDQYSLAVTYVELRTGRLPYRSEIFAEVMGAVLRNDLDLTMLPPGERDVIRRATALKPDERYPTTLEMVRGLREALRDPQPITVSAPGENIRETMFDDSGNHSLTARLPAAEPAPPSVPSSTVATSPAASVVITPPTISTQETMPANLAPAAAVTSSHEVAAEQQTSKSAVAAPSATLATSSDSKPKWRRSKVAYAVLGGMLLVVGTLMAWSRNQPKVDEPISTPPTVASIELTAAEELFKLGDYRQAIAVLDKIIAANPTNSADARLLRGTAYLELKDYPKAIEDLNATVAARADDLRGYSRRATARSANGDVAGAVKDYSKAIEISPGPEDHHARGLAHARMQNYQQAIDDFTHALRYAPSNAEDIYQVRAAVAAEAGQNNVADRDAQTLALLDAHHTAKNDDQWYGKLALIVVVDPKDRELLLSRIVPLADSLCQDSQYEHPEHLDLLAMLLAAKGEFSRAVQWQQRAVERSKGVDKAAYEERLDKYRQQKAWSRG